MKAIQPKLDISLDNIYLWKLTNIPHLLFQVFFFSDI